MPTRVLHIVPHTHWDREWYEPFPVVRYRLVKVVDAILEALDDPAFGHFMLDGQTAAIEDYLEIRPGATDDVAAAVRDGRLAIGPWRIIADQFLCSPETLVRNLQQGAGAAESLGGWMPVGYLPDPFGHIGQMPQLLRGVGIADAVVWRGVPAAIDRTLFRWEAPDGSWVRTVYLPFGYGHAAGLPETPEELSARTERIWGDLAPFEPGANAVALNGSDHAGPQPHLPALLALDGDEVRLGSLTSFLDTQPDGSDAPVWRGELRSGARANLLMGVLSARPELKRAEAHASTTLERYAEPLAALAGTRPGLLLERAWRALVENSAHDSVTGCGIDDVARDVEARYDEAQRLGDLIAADALEALAAQIDTTHLADEDEALVAFDPSPRARRGAAEVTLAIPAGTMPTSVIDRDGATGHVQVLETRPQRALDMTLRGTQLAKLVPMVANRRISDLFVNRVEVRPGRPTTITLSMGMSPEGSFDVEAAKRAVEQAAARSPRGRFHVIGDGPPLVTMLVDVPEVPGVGWRVVRPSAEAGPATRARAEADALDNGIVRAEIAADGTVSVRRGDVHFTGTLGISDGGDAGDEYNHCPPDRDLIVTAPAEDPVVDLIRDGPVEAALRITRRFRVPVGLTADGRGRARRTSWLPVVTDLAVRVGEPFVRATLRISNDAKDHRVRALFPLPFRAAGSSADGAFEVVERGLTAEGGPHETGLPTFPSRRWVSVSDGTTGLAILHRGTPEYEVIDDGRTLALTLIRSVGILSRHGMATRAAPAGPVLPTPGAQAQGEHVIELALFPHDGTWRDAGVNDVADAFCAPLRVTGTRRHEGPLAAGAGALSVEPSSVALSALTAAAEGVVVRVVNLSEEPVDARLTVGDPLPRGSADRVDLLNRRVGPASIENGVITLPLRAWEIGSVLLA